MSCMTILFSLLANHERRHQPQVKWTVNLVIADCHLIIIRGLCGYIWVNVLTKNITHEGSVVTSFPDRKMVSQ